MTRTLTLLTAVLASTFASVATAACPDQVQTYLIEGGSELPRGVPNYDQASFSPGSGDCSPTAIAQVLGYWDANGWSNIFRDTSPYLGTGQHVAVAHPSIDNAVTYLKDNLHYSYATGGTVMLPGVVNWGPTANDFVTEQVPLSRFSFWDGYVSFDSDIRPELDADRPLVLSVHGVPGMKFSWGSPTGTPLRGTLDHSMATVGYRHVVKFADTIFGCVDWMYDDDRFVVLRSGWKSGGDNVVYYHWNHWDRKTRLSVTPGGSPGDVDDREALVFGDAKLHTWQVELDRTVGISAAVGAAIPGLPANPDAATTTADGKAHIFDGSQYWRVDVDSMTVDAGYPVSIASAWPGIPNDLDAAVWSDHRQGLIYFFKGSNYYTWHVGDDSLWSGAKSISAWWHGISGTVDAAMNYGNGRIYFFQGTNYTRYDLMNDRADAGYPLSTATYWPGLPTRPDAIVSPQRQLRHAGSVKKDEERMITFDVGSVPRDVTFELTGTGDADLYVRRGVAPTTGLWDCRPYDPDSTETCSLSNLSGRVYVMVRGYAPSSTFDVSASWAE